MTQNEWVKEVSEQILKPLSQWRDELYGYWMVVTDAKKIDGVEMAVARYYGTDKEKLLDIWDEFYRTKDEPNAVFYCNKKNNWMGGAFIAKP